jgi:nicotinate-nucleotide adenylyltransferase
MKVGIMGGTFDPIHMGHLIAAERAREEAELDEVWFLPAYTPPHKKHQPLASPEQRVQMIRLSIEGNPYFRLSQLEMERQGTSYTIDTMKALIGRHPEYYFYFIIGADMVEYLPKWYKIEELIGLIQFIGLARPGFSIPSINRSSFHEQNAERIQFVTMPLLDISSTEIREREQMNRSIRYLVHPDVEKYIKGNGLYGP